MKIYTSEHVFEHPWETVVKAAWKKYPNPLNPNVVELDVINRKVAPNGVLHTHRLMTTSWGIPDWVRGFLGMNPEVHVSERSEVNPHAKTMTLKSTNLTLDSLITIDEKLEYMPHPERPNCTLLKQEAVIGIQHIPMSSYLEDMVKGSCSSNAVKGRQAMEHVIQKIKDDAQTLSRSAEEQLQSISRSAEDKMETLKSTFTPQSDRL